MTKLEKRLWFWLMGLFPWPNWLVSLYTNRFIKDYFKEKK